jgi:hypothetical protein
MANISIRGVEESTIQHLKETARQKGVSVNKLVADLLNAEAGVSRGMGRPVVYRDLDSLAGTWSAEEAKAFEETIFAFEGIDEDLWR